jgi:hypothetical protein
VHPSVFELLPPLPACILSSRDAFTDGVSLDGSLYSPSSFLQPEFYPSFPLEGLVVWSTPSLTHYGAVGVSAHPFSRSVRAYSGESLNIRFFLRAGYGVRSFQEGRLDVSASSPLLTGVLDDVSSRSIVLEPSFPQFYSGWVHPVDLTVSVSPDASPGDYSISVYTAPVSPADQSFTPLEGEYYYSFTDFVGSRRVFELNVTVLEG